MGCGPNLEFNGYEYIKLDHTFILNNENKPNNFSNTLLVFTKTTVFFTGRPTITRRKLNKYAVNKWHSMGTFR